MNLPVHRVVLSVSLIVFSLESVGQAPNGKVQNPQVSTSASGNAAASASAQGGTGDETTQGQLDTMQKQLKTIQDYLKNQDSDFALTLGVGSLVLNSGITDYTNSSNVLEATNLGRATPQYLVGVSMRTTIPNFAHLGDKAADCKDKNPPDPGSKCELWRRRPWEGFVSVKFSPQASQTINGYVIGGSYAIAKWLDVLIGFALSPINEPSPGFRVSASQYVTEQQALGHYLNFDPTAMLNNKQNAFDGFPLTDSNGKLIYTGSPTEVHYRGGAVFGVSIPGCSIRPHALI